MQLWVGLGNPGAKYAGNRHNIGFMALERIAGGANWQRKFQGEVAEARFGSVRVILLKPMTFMNESGRSVQEALRFHKLEPADMTVFHDEIDLAPGKVRHKSGGGHAGHNGLRSIHAHVGPHYDRVRLGVGHPGHKDAVPGYVLRDFPKADRDWLDDLLRGIEDGAPLLAAGDPGRFLNAVNLRLNPPRSSAPAKPKAEGGDRTLPASPAPEEASGPFAKLAAKFRR